MLCAHGFSTHTPFTRLAGPDGLQCVPVVGVAIEIASIDLSSAPMRSFSTFSSTSHIATISTFGIDE
jgi:hypothetical protein